MTCPHCSGLMVREVMYDHGVVSVSNRCIMCGRYQHVGVQTAAVSSFQKRLAPKLQWKRVNPEIIPRIENLLLDGNCPTDVARKVGIHVLTVRKMIAKFGWEYRSARPNRRAKA